MTDEINIAFPFGSDQFVGSHVTDEISLAFTLDPDEFAGGIRPTVKEVAALLRTRTVGESSGGLGGDTGPGDVTTFTDTTRPTAEEVEGLISQAIEAVLGALPAGFDAVAFNPRVRHLVTLYAAILVEGSFFREQLDSGSVELWRDLYRTGLAALTTAIAGSEETAGHARGSAVVSSMIPVYEPPLDLGWG